MSYCHFFEADIYLYDDVGGYICCCRCSLEEDDRLPSATIVLEHIEKHRAAGHFVPDHVDERLREEIADGYDERGIDSVGGRDNSGTRVIGDCRIDLLRGG